MSLTLFIISVLAGLLTVLAPCVLPLLPIILGSSVTDGRIKRVLWVVAGLCASISIFTILFHTALRSSVNTNLLDQTFLNWISAAVIALFGIALVFPRLWTWVSVKSGFEHITNKGFEKTNTNSWWSSALLGASLGPVFTSCSPTYFVIIGLLASQESSLDGVILLGGYILGLAVSLTIIGLLGQIIVKPLKSFADPKGVFKKAIGILFILLALAIGTGFIKDIETALLDVPIFQNLIEFEESLIP